MKQSCRTPRSYCHCWAQRLPSQFILVATLVVICLQLTMATSYGSDFGSRYMVRTGIYPADTQYERGYRIPTYLPYGSLFFVVDEKTTSEKNWVRVISQFGQEYFIGTDNLRFVKNNVTIRRTIANLYGNQDYVFHGNQLVCPVALEDRKKYENCDPDASIEIVRGDVAQAVQGNNDNIVELTLHKKVDGNVFFEREKLNVLIEKGLVTDLRNSYPRFLRKSRTKVEPLSVKCGTPIKKISYEEIETSIGAEVNASFSSGFSLGNFVKSIIGVDFFANASKRKSEKVQLESEFGGADHGVNAYILLVDDLRQKGLRQFDIFTRTKCIASSRKKPNIYLERLEVYENGATNPLVEIEFSEIYEWPVSKQLTTSDAPYIVWSLNNKRPFLTSINSRADYWNIHAVFLRDTQDADLASLLISEFNASCIRQKRLGKEPYLECRKVLPAKTFE